MPSSWYFFKYFDSSLNDFEEEIESKKIQCDVSAKPPMLITTDKQRVEQVLTNIVVNSIDFVPKDTGKISVSVKLEKRSCSIYYTR